MDATRHDSSAAKEAWGTNETPEEAGERRRGQIKENMLGEDTKDTKELSVKDFPINSLHTASQVHYRSLHHHH